MYGLNIKIDSRNAKLVDMDSVDYCQQLVNRLEINRGENSMRRILRGSIVINGKLAVTDEYDWQFTLDCAERTAKSITQGKRAYRNRQGRGGRRALQLTQLGKDLLRLCETEVLNIERHAAGFLLKGPGRLEGVGWIQADFNGLPLTIMPMSFNPYIKVMFRACLAARKRLGALAAQPWDGHSRAIQAVLAFVVDFVRRVCRHKTFQRVVANNHRTEIKNRRSCLHYLDRLFENHSKLLVLRVDLYVKPEEVVWSTSNDAEKCIGAFLRALREGRIIEPDVLGWICKREGGFRRGIHYHTLIVLDGHKHMCGSQYGKLIGEAWRERYSMGRGSYFNCWALRKRYRYNALGVVCRDDLRMKYGLYLAVKYMTKNDCQVETGRGRNLRRGVMPRIRQQSNDGASRRIPKTA